MKRLDWKQEDLVGLEVPMLGKIFFVKANNSTSLSVYNTSEPANYKLLSTNAPISFPTSEPQARQDPPVSNQAFSFPELSYQLENKVRMYYIQIGWYYYSL